MKTSTNLINKLLHILLHDETINHEFQKTSLFIDNINFAITEIKTVCDEYLAKEEVRKLIRSKVNKTRPASVAAILPLLNEVKKTERKKTKLINKLSKSLAKK
ncbi:MAG: hypothetical protein Q7U38_04830 [Methylobacter sp.]|nr:hypothetical protein [Methylobacter sp.]MDP2100109.1 hypothetical protein [Methylobacter sp.]MDP2429443.1 hypothetical protein [Methylobacter sp.]MDP3055568.1 hypothetical protein [Methylobacter sp.]MDP3363420.1 hypothetical protein [Methylobacter sp.]